MKATLAALAALLLVGAAQAGPYDYPCPPPVVRYAPDACGPGWYGPNEFGMIYGPNYCVYPPYPPFNGLLPPPNRDQGQAAFGSHPFARSPRDFFMIGD